jgi:SAM-dependent methyltransferase
VPITDSELLNCPACRVIGLAGRTFTRGEVDFRVCSSCGVLFREQMPSEGELEAIYRVHYSNEKIDGGRTEQESGEYALNAYFRFIMDEILPRDVNVLDFGAGAGRLVELFRSAGLKADGLEFSADARGHCSEHRGIDLLADIGQIEQKKYDFVTMIEVIEHLPAIHEDLQKIRDCMRPGGMLLLTTPNRMGLRARLEKGEWQEARKKFHLVLFDRKSLEKVLLGAGFSRVEWIRFSPVQKSGVGFWIYARLCQLIGLGGTLCAVARR